MSKYKEGPGVMRLRACLVALIWTMSVASVHAQTTFQDWFLIDSDDKSGDVIAGTSTSDGKEILGYRCFLSSGSCLYVLMSRSTCEEKEKYPILQNSSGGASMITGTCFKTGESDQLMLAPYERIETAIKLGDGLIGFAIPMRSGQFRAIRFSLKGGKDAIQAAELLANVRKKAFDNRPASSVF